MDKIMKRLSNLLSVKSLVTLLLTVVFTVLALRGDITGKDFLTIRHAVAESAGRDGREG